MKAKIDIVGQKTIFTNDDELAAEVVVKRSYDEPYFSTLITSVEFKLACEGQFNAVNDGKTETKLVKYFESDPVIGRCNYTTRGHVIYSGQLKFPGRENKLPSSLAYDSRKVNGIRWSVKAVIHRGDKDECQHVERSCMFRPLAQLPSLLNLVDVEHSEVVDDSKVSIVTTHAAAGLPQVPLAAGISFSVRCDKPGKFSVSRLRLLLHENNDIRMGKLSKRLPLRRWLLEDYRPRNNDVPLDRKTVNLERWVGDVHVDHTTLAPSFETADMTHSFDLVVELFVSWKVESGPTLTKKLSSISPVTVLPRMSGAQYSAVSPSIPANISNVYPGVIDTPPHVIFDPAEITDTTDDEIDSADFGDVSEKESEERVSNLSSDSANSVLSDHMKLEMDGVHVKDVGLPSIVTTSSF